MGTTSPGSEETLNSAYNDPWLGRVLKEKYRLERRLGEGGFGAVYAARHLLIGTWHAIKLLNPQLGNRPELMERFREEARIGQALRHPRIVPVTDFDFEGETLFLVMDLIESRTLTDRIRKTPADVPRNLESWARDIASALDYAHSKHVVHRDIKPSNILIREQDQAAMLTDFGISRWLHAVGLTQTGTTIGTFAYMSPEQCRDEDRSIDARSDIYSFAVLLFELTCGRPPFGIGKEAMQGHLHNPVPPVSRFRPDLVNGPSLDAVFAHGLAKSPNDRPQSATELVVDLIDAMSPTTVDVPAVVSVDRSAEKTVPAGSAPKTVAVDRPVPPNPPPSGEPPPTPHLLRLPLPIVAALVAVALIFASGGVLVLTRLNVKNLATTQTTTSPKSSPAPSTSFSPTSNTSTPTPSRSALPAPTGAVTKVSDLPTKSRAFELTGKPVAFGGDIKLDALGFSFDSAHIPKEADYDAGGRYERFQAQVLIDDTSGLKQAHFGVFGDDRLIGEAIVKYGFSQNMDLVVTGVQKLRLTINIPPDLFCMQMCGPAYFVSARLYAAPAVVPPPPSPTMRISEISGDTPDYFGPVQASGRPYVDAVLISAQGQPKQLNYTLGGRYQRLKLTEMVTDNSSAPVRILFATDGNVISENLVQVGDTKYLELNVSGVQTISVIVSTPGPCGIQGCSANAAFANSSLT